MALSGNKAAVTAGNIQPLDQGSYAARLVRVVDLGVQETTWQGQVRKADQLMATFEFMDEYLLDEDGNPNLELPRVLSIFVKLYRGAKRGRNVELLQALDPGNNYKGDWGELCKARVPCLLNVTVTEAGRNRISSVAPPMKGLNYRPCKVEGYVFDLDSPDRDVYDSLPDFIKEIIAERVDGAEPICFNKSEATVIELQKDSETTELGSEGEDVPW